MSLNPEKILLRKKILAKRASLLPEEITQASENLASFFCQTTHFTQHEHFACYIANQGEINPAPMIEAIFKAKKKCYLPVLHPEKKNELLFQHYEPDDLLIPNRYKIPEPLLDNTKLISPEDLDIVLIPLVAFDRQGNRLGMGAGYYDRTFAFHQAALINPLLIGLGYDFQQVDHVPHEAWDVKLTQVLTESGIKKFI